MKDFFRQNGILILIVAILLALVTAVVSLALGGTATPLANFANWITTPVRNGISAFADWSQERYDNAFAQEQLREENERLKQRVAELEQKERDYEAALQENERLRNLNGLRPSNRTFETESAKVTARSTSNWESTLTISKGSSMDIAVGNCVVDEYWNLVGVVAEVGSNYAIVRTLVDAETQMGGLISRTDGAAILEGDFSLMGQGKLKLTYLPESSDLIAGDLVLTSGKGGVYPSGLVAGHVEELHTEASGMTRYAVIQPETDLDSLAQVFVIKSFDIVE